MSLGSVFTGGQDPLIPLSRKEKHSADLFHIAPLAQFQRKLAFWGRQEISKGTEESILEEGRPAPLSLPASRVRQVVGSSLGEKHRCTRCLEGARGLKSVQLQFFQKQHGLSTGWISKSPNRRARRKGMDESLKASHASNQIRHQEGDLWGGGGMYAVPIVKG